MKGSWEGGWNADRSEFTGTYTFPDGRKFKGVAQWLDKRERTHITPSGHVAETVTIPMTPHWEYTGSWVRRDGKGATAAHMPEPPEERDDGEPPPEADEEDDEPVRPLLPRAQPTRPPTQPPERLEE